MGNEGNNDRIAECVMCFNRANPMLIGHDHKEKDMHMHMKKDHMDKEHHFRKIFNKYAACANVYLAPAYSECFEQMDELLELDIEEWRSKKEKARLTFCKPVSSLSKATIGGRTASIMLGRALKALKHLENVRETRLSIG